MVLLIQNVVILPLLRVDLVADLVERESVRLRKIRPHKNQKQQIIPVELG